MISPSRQRIRIKKIPYFYNFYIIMSAFYTFLSSLYNCLLKFISLILLGEVYTQAAGEFPLNKITLG